MKEVKKTEFLMRCFSCTHRCGETADDVSFCNVCGEYVDQEDAPGIVYDCYDPENDKEVE